MIEPVPSFMWSWPSWLVEGIGGLLGGAAMGALFRAVFRPRLWWLWAAVTATLLSLGYEGLLDPNHWSLADVLLREPWLVLAAWFVSRET